MELTRGLMAEYGTAKVLLPRSKKPLEFDADGTYDKKAWSEIAKESGPAARTGDIVQITKISIESRPHRAGNQRRLQRRPQMVPGRAGPGTMGQQVPIGNSDSNAPGGTSIALLFHKPLEPIKSAEIKKMLAPVLDFDKHSVTEIYSETLPPEVQKAIKEKRASEGMNHEQVSWRWAGPSINRARPRTAWSSKTGSTATPPGKITFVTFNGDKVIKVKEDYAGLGTQVQ